MTNQLMCEACGDDAAVLVVPMSCRPRALCGLCGEVLAPERMPAVMAVAA